MLNDVCYSHISCPQFSNETILIGYDNNLPELGEDHTSQIILEYGIDAINCLSYFGFNSVVLSSEQLAEIVDRHGVDIITPLIAVGADFSALEVFTKGLPPHILVDAIKEDGLQIIKVLSKLGANFKSLNTYHQMIELVDIYGFEVIGHLKAVDVDVSVLVGQYYDLNQIITKHGMKSINLLSEAGVDFSKLGIYVIKELIIEHGLEIIGHLKAAGSNISIVGYIYYLQQIITKHGMESIKLFSDAGVDFTKLSDHGVKELIIEHGPKLINHLKAAGTDLPILGDYYLRLIIVKYGLEAIITLAKTGYDFRTLVEAWQWAKICFKKNDLIDLFKIKDGHGLSLGYYFLHSQLSYEEKIELQALNSEYLGSSNHTVFSKGTYSYFGTGNKTSKVMFIMGHDHNGAFRLGFIDTYYKEGYDALIIDLREKITSNARGNSYLAFLKENNLSLSKGIDLVWISAHGHNFEGTHFVTLGQGNSVDTAYYIKDYFGQYFIDKPYKVVILSCHGSNAIDRSIKDLPVGSEIVALGRNATNNEKALNMNLGIQRQLRYLIEEREYTSNRNSLLTVKDITILSAYLGTIPTYVKKIGEDQVVKIQCSDGKGAEAANHKLLHKFSSQICGDTNRECEQKLYDQLGNNSESNPTRRALACYISLIDV